MKKLLLLLLIWGAGAQTAFAQRKTVAVLPSDGGSLSQEQTDALTDRVHKAAISALPAASFTILRQDVVIKRLGGAESYVKECLEGTCIVDMGKKAQADYVAKASVGLLEGKLRLKVELYNVKTEGSVGLFDDDYADFSAMRAAIDGNIPNMFRQIPGAPKGKASSEKLMTNISTVPEGAFLSINGEPFADCPQTPCSVELGDGEFRIMAAKELYEKADTTVSVWHSNQSVSIRLKPSFGTFEIKPAYLEDMSNGKPWNVKMNGYEASSFKNDLSTGNYAVKLSHECYEDISFTIGIDKNSHEVFDMASHIKPKTSELYLEAVKGGEPGKETVMINGRNAGKTPFSGAVPICADVNVGGTKATVKLAQNEKIIYKHKIRGKGGSFKDSRDGQVYRTTKIGSQTWMAENLRYESKDGKNYGRYDYDWNTAANRWYRGRTGCPYGWHLPDKSEWDKLIEYIEKNEETINIGSYLKSEAGADSYGFAASADEYWSATKDGSGQALTLYINPFRNSAPQWGSGKILPSSIPQYLIGGSIIAASAALLYMDLANGFEGFGSSVMAYMLDTKRSIIGFSGFTGLIGLFAGAAYADSKPDPGDYNSVRCVQN